MAATALLFGILYVIQSSNQYSLGLSIDRMVSSPWTGDILTDNWSGVPRGCNSKPADVYLVMDTSADTPTLGLEVAEQKRYLSRLAALFYLPKATTRLGVLSYGSTPIITSPLASYSSLQQLQDVIEDTPEVGGERRTDKALRHLRIHGFSSLLARSEVAHVVILMTNGYSSDPKLVAKEAQLLRKRGVYVYTVSDVTSGPVDRRELSEISSQPSDQFVFSSRDWDALESLIKILHIKECNYPMLSSLPGKEPICFSRRPTQIAFAVEHIGLGGSKTQKLLSFVSNMLAEVDPKSDIKAAILTSNDPVTPSALSSQVETIQSLEKKLGEVAFPDLGHLLKKARRTLKGRGKLNGKGRWRKRQSKNSLKSNSVPEADNVQKVVVLFLDSSLHLTKTSLTASLLNRRHKLDTYVVYIGEAGDRAHMQEVRRLASGRDHVILVDSYEELDSQTVVDSTLRKVCTGL